MTSQSPTTISAASLASNAGEWAALSALIGRIYECAIDPGQWDDTLTQMAALLSPPDWDVIMLVWERIGAPGGRFLGATNVTTMAREIYLATFAGQHPWSRRILALPIGRVVDTDEIMPRSEIVESDFYKAYLSTWKLQLAVAVVLDRKGPEKLGLVMPGPDGHDIGGLKRGLRLLAPHLQRAARISHALGEANLRAGAAEAALDRAPVAVVSLSRDFAVLSANAKAQALVEAGWAAIAGGRFAFRDPRAQAELVRLADTAPPASAAFKTAGPGGEELAVLAARLPPQLARTLTGEIEGAALIVSIGLGARAPLIAIDRLRAWFGLTPSEARLAAWVAGGKDLTEYVALRGVSMNAARFLLKGIYRKTQTGSQAALVARLRDLPAG